MLLLLGQLAQAGGHLERLVVLADLSQRLDQIGRDRERPGVVHALALRVLPDVAQAFDRSRWLMGEQGGDPARPERFELVPADARRHCARDRLRSPFLRLARKSPAGGEQRAAPLVHRPDQELAFIRLAPLVEPACRRLPLACSQLELAEVEPLQEVRDRLASLVGEGEQPREERPRVRQLASPDEPLPVHSLGGADEVERIVG